MVFAVFRLNLCKTAWRGDVEKNWHSDIDLEHRVLHLERGVKEVWRRDGLQAEPGRDVKVGKLKSATSKRTIPLNDTATAMIQDLRKGSYFGENTPLVPDELPGAPETGLIDGEEALRRIAARPQALEVVVTGRNPPAALCGMADYITEMKKIRHPMDAGITARKGVEF